MSFSMSRTALDPITAKEHDELTDCWIRACKNAAIAMGYSGEKSALRHVADDLPAYYVPPVPLSRAEEARGF